MFRDLKGNPQSSDSSQKIPELHCERCSQENDDRQILISVDPKIIRLFKNCPRESNITIKNRNAFPVFFKTCSTNMSAFVPQPITGRISPYNEAEITLYLKTKNYASASPIRNHEEIIILTSLHPFRKISENVCSYCYKIHTSEPQIHEDDTIYKTYLEKQISNKPLRDEGTFEDEIKFVCKTCNQHIETKDMKIESVYDSKKCRKISGIVAEHKCKAEDIFEMKMKLVCKMCNQYIVIKDMKIEDNCDSEEYYKYSVIVADHKCKAEDTFEGKRQLVCETCNQHIVTKNMELEDVHGPYGYHKYSGYVTDHKCEIKDNIKEITLKTSSIKTYPESKMEYRSTKEITLHKETDDASKNMKAESPSAVHVTENGVFFPNNYSEKGYSNYIGDAAYHTKRYPEPKTRYRSSKEITLNKETDDGAKTESPSVYKSEDDAFLGKKYPEKRYITEKAADHIKRHYHSKADYQKAKDKVFRIRVVNGEKAESLSEDTSENADIIHKEHTEKNSKCDSEYVKKFSESARQKDVYKKGISRRRPKDLKHEIMRGPHSPQKIIPDYNWGKPHICAKIRQIDSPSISTSEGTSESEEFITRKTIFISERDVKKYDRHMLDEECRSVSEVSLAVETCRRQKITNKKRMATLDQKYSKILRISKTTLFFLLLFLFGNIYYHCMKREMQTDYIDDFL